MSQIDKELLPDIKVIGVGGGGGNAVNRMVRASIPGVEFVAVNTDKQALSTSKAERMLRIGEKQTKGLGVGGDPTRGERAAEESRGELEALLQGAEMVFVAAGMGGGTGTGAAPVVAEVARELGALTIGTVTTPFAWEGAARARAAQEGIERMRDKVDTLISIPNARLLEICPEDCTVEQAFETADDVLRQAIQAISNIISQNGSINLDFNDVRTVMSEAGQALLAIGAGTGDNRAAQAAQAATASPLLDQTISGATKVLFNVTHDGSLKLREMDMAARVIAEVVDSSANTIFGTVVDESVGETVHMTVIATGFKPAVVGLPQPARSRSTVNLELPGISHEEDAELPAFLRRNLRPMGEHAAASAERGTALTERR